MTDEKQNEATRILQSPGSWDSDELLALVYGELRRLAAAQMAGEKVGQTIQPTALVHEAYVRLVNDKDMQWDSRGHFFAVAARSMRQILINRANKKKAIKHGGGRQRQDFDEQILVNEPEPDRILALDVALERLEEIDPRKAQIVMLRYFAGLSIEDTAHAMGLSVATVKREWQFSRTWLHREITQIDS